MINIWLALSGSLASLLFGYFIAVLNCKSEKNEKINEKTNIVFDGQLKFDTIVVETKNTIEGIKLYSRFSYNGILVREKLIPSCNFSLPPDTHFYFTVDGIRGLI